jgi:hypothetical protein
MFASSKVGAIVLDTKLDAHLLEVGFIADFRSAVQSVRKEANLSLTDKIFLEVFCEPNRVNLIEKFSQKLRKDLIATGIKFFPPNEVNTEIAHKFYIHDGSIKTTTQILDMRSSLEACDGKPFDESELDKEPFYVNIYKEG